LVGNTKNRVWTIARYTQDPHKEPGIERFGPPAPREGRLALRRVGTSEVPGPFGAILRRDFGFAPEHFGPCHTGSWCNNCNQQS